MNKLIRFLFVSLCMVAGLTLTAQTFKHEGIWYSVIDTKSVAVAPPESGEYYEGSVEIPGSINYRNNDYSVTKVAAYAFRESNDFVGGHHKLTSVTMANNITAIEESAFENCINLQSIKISNRTVYVGVNAFANCLSLTSVTLSSNLEEIRDGAFMNCEKIGQISLGSKLKKIGNGAFAGCTTLSSVTIPDAVTSIGNESFKNCPALNTVKFGIDLEKIGESAFENCAALKVIELPNKLTVISPSTFAGCSILSSVSFGVGVATISDKAFYGCKAISDLTIPASVNEIGENSFGGCDGVNTLTFADSSNSLRYGNGNFTTSPIERLTLGRTLQYTSDNPGAFSERNRETSSLKRVEITSAVSELPSAIFRGCRVLNNVTIATGLQKIGSRAFEGCEALTSLRLPETVESIMSDGFAKCYFLADFNLPSKVTVLEVETFFECRALTTMDLSNVTEIKNSAFQECSRLQDVTFSSNLRAIGRDAFNTCLDLRSITIPESVHSIGGGAFFESGLVDIISLAINPPTAEDDTWDEAIYNRASLTVPSKSYGKYRAAEGWKNFSNFAQVMTYTVTVNANEGGSVLLNGASVNEIEVKEKESVKIDVLPALGRVIDSASYTMGGETKTFANTITISPVTDNVTVDVVFGYTPPTSIAFTSKSYYTKPGETVDLSVVYTPEDSYAPVVYSIVNGADVVSIVGSTVTGLKLGVATVRATTDKGLSAECSVTVDDGSLYIEDIPFDLIYRYQPIQCILHGAQIDPDLITWTSSDESNFKFFDNGILMFDGNDEFQGNVILTATLPSGQSATKEMSLNATDQRYVVSLDNDHFEFYSAVAPFEMCYGANDIDSDCIVQESVRLDGFDYKVTAVEIKHYGFYDGPNYSLTLPVTIKNVTIDDNFINRITCKATVPPTGNVWLWKDQQNVIYVPAESVEAYKASDVWNSYMILAIGQEVSSVWNVAVTSNEGGFVTLNGEKTNNLKIDDGSGLSIVVYPDDDKFIKSASYTMNGKTVSFDGENRMDIESVTGDVEICIEYADKQVEPNVYTVKTKTNFGGSVFVNNEECSIAWTSYVKEGDSLTISVVPYDGYYIQNASYRMGTESVVFTDYAVINAVTNDVEIDVDFALAGTPVDPGQDFTSETAVFDFTAPSFLNPSQNPNSSNSPVCEIAGVNFTDKQISLVANGGGTSSRLWYAKDHFECRVYNGATITISVKDNSSVIKGFCINGSQIDALQVYGNVLEEGVTYSLSDGVSSFDINCVSNGSHKRADISSIWIEYLTETGIDDVIADGNAEVTVYSVKGYKVGDTIEGLAPGIYIVKKGSKTSKVVIQ